MSITFSGLDGREPPHEGPLNGRIFADDHGWYLLVHPDGKRFRSYFVTDGAEGRDWMPLDSSIQDKNIREWPHDVTFDFLFSGRYELAMQGEIR